MNARTAENLLRCYRAGKRPDSRVQKAVRFAEGDPALRRQLSDQMEFDEQIVDVIHFIKPPEDLRQKLRDLSAKLPAAKPSLRRVILQPAMLAAISGVLLIIGILVFFVIESMERFPGREALERMIASTKRTNAVEFETVSTTPSEMADWFMLRRFEGFDPTPPLAALPVVLARVFWLDGQPVAQLAVDRHDSIIYQFRAAEFGVDLPQDADWRVFEHENWVAALRQRGGHGHMIAFRGGKSEMKEFLQSLPKEHLEKEKPRDR